jgi:two-component system, OmpR family, heavy metal sensor histidine kinase CusS
LFRVKIALLTVMLSGLILVAFGVYSLSVMNRVALDRIDREILSLGEGHLALGPPRNYWQNFEESLKLIYREGRAENLIVQIKDPGNEILFKSPHWPAEIKEDSFPNFDRTMDTRPPVPQSHVNMRDMRPSPPLEARPPLEAYQACEGKSAGTPAQFVSRRGETISGICEEEEGKLVLRQTDPKGDARAYISPGREQRSRPSPAGNPQDKPVPRIKKPYFATIQTSSGIWRTGIIGSERITMMVGANMAEYYEDAGRYRRALLAAIPAALLFLAAGGWWISQRALKPVALITRTAEKITVRALDQRVPRVESDKELSHLVEVINGMLDRLEKSFGQALRFSADAAHELQTPLTILQGELDAALQHAPVGSEEQQRASGLLEEVQRLKAIVRKLLILARADAGKLNLQLVTTDLSALIEEAAEDAGVMAPTLTIEKEITSGVIIKADRDLLGQAINNLMSNAVKYNQPNGVIRFRLSVIDNRALFTIANTSAPIPEKDRDKIFDRFYRIDPSRGKALAGTGLGLSLAREIVHAHGGRLSLDSAVNSLVSFTMMVHCISAGRLQK